MLQPRKIFLSELLFSSNQFNFSQSFSLVFTPFTVSLTFSFFVFLQTHSNVLSSFLFHSLSLYPISFFQTLSSFLSFVIFKLSLVFVSLSPFSFLLFIFRLFFSPFFVFYISPFLQFFLQIFYPFFSAKTKSRFNFGHSYMKSMCEDKENFTFKF